MPTSQVSRFEQLLAARAHRTKSTDASQAPRFEQLLAGLFSIGTLHMLRSYRASSSTYPSRWARYSPASFVGSAFFSTRLPLSRESEGARGPRENDTSSIAISNFSVCRIMRFIDTSLRAAACSELLNSRGVYFAGNALRAAAYRNSPKLI